jgi:hypothetical protein
VPQKDALTALIMTQVLPVWLTPALEGSIVAYVSLCQVALGEGNGGCKMNDRKDIVRGREVMGYGLSKEDNVN